MAAETDKVKTCQGKQDSQTSLQVCCCMETGLGLILVMVFGKPGEI